MYLRALIILSLLLSALGLGALALRPLVPDAPEPAAEAPAILPPARARILVAAHFLPAGALLKEGDLTVREVPPDAVPPDAVPEEARAETGGGLLRRYLEAGEALPRDAVLRPRDRGFLSGVLRPGFRAIAVGVDVVTGTAGLIWPGDEVDLILTQELTAAEAPLGRRVIGETVLTGVRVIAVDQQLSQGAIGAGTAGARDAAGVEVALGRVARTVTLEVTGEGAERVAVAGRLGRISLTVRAIGAQPGGPAGGPIFGADVSPALGAGTASQGARMQVIQGGDKQEVVFR